MAPPGERPAGRTDQPERQDWSQEGPSPGPADDDYDRRDRRDRHDHHDHHHNHHGLTGPF
jgi:hypothetical protein